MTAPMLAPAMTAGRTPSSSRALRKAMWLSPLAPPAPSARPTRFMGSLCLCSESFSSLPLGLKLSGQFPEFRDFQERNEQGVKADAQDDSSSQTQELAQQPSPQPAEQ